MLGSDRMSLHAFPRRFGAPYPDMPVVAGPSWPGVFMFTTTRLGRQGQPGIGLDLSRQQDRVKLEACLPGPVYWLKQVHGTRVLNEMALPQPDVRSSPPEGDALITTRAGRALAILTADCLPIVLVCVQRRAVAVVHAGWRGLAAGILEKTLASLQQACPTAGLHGWRAWVGPAITQPVFEVGTDVYEAFTLVDPSSAIFFMPGVQQQKWLADLPGLARHRLQRAGVAWVEISKHCTSRQAAWFYSYRRNRDTGRQATIVWLADANHLPSLTVRGR